MKILLINNLYPPYARGGAEKVVEWTAEALDRSGHEVVIISTAPNAKACFEMRGKIKIWRFKPLNFFYYYYIAEYGVVSRFFWHVFDAVNWFSARQVKKLIQLEEPELIVTHNLKGLSLLIPRMIRKLNIKHYHVLHDVQLAVPSGLIIKGREKSLTTTGLLVAIYAAAIKLIFGSPDKVLSPSRWLMNFYQAKGFFKNSPKQILRNPNPPDWPAIEPKSEKHNAYLFIGQIEEHKGVIWLINLWFKSNLTRNLNIVGSGNYPINRLKLPTNIQLQGKQEGEDLRNIFAQVDYLIVPSLCYENSPTVIQLAYLAGVPVIAAKIGGVGELIQDNQTGYLYEAGDEISFLKAYNNSRQISNMDYLKQSQACFEKSKEFDVDKYILELLS